MKRGIALFIVLALTVSLVPAMADGQGPQSGEWVLTQIYWGERRTPMRVVGADVTLSMDGKQFDLYFHLPEVGESDSLSGTMWQVNGNTCQAVVYGSGRYDLTFVQNAGVLTLLMERDGGVLAFFLFTLRGGYATPTPFPVPQPVIRIPTPTPAPAPTYAPWPVPTAAPGLAGRVVMPYAWDTQFKLGMSTYTATIDRSWMLPNLYDDNPQTNFSWTVWMSDQNNGKPHFTAYFNRNTVSQFGIRNGNVRSYNEYSANARPRQLRLVIYHDGGYTEKNLSIPDNCTTSYQLFPLGAQFRGVTRIDIFMTGYVVGGTQDGKYACHITDIQFYE